MLYITLIISVIIILFVILITALVTTKAYEFKHTVDPHPDDAEQEKKQTSSE